MASGAIVYRIGLIVTLGALLCGCETAPPLGPVEPMALIGTLDLSQPGIGIRVADSAKVVRCDAHYAQGRLPDAVSLPLVCADNRAGTLQLTKAPELHGKVAFADGGLGDVTFAETALLAPVVAVAPPIAPVSSHSGSTTAPRRSYVRTQTYSSGYARAHTRRATYVSGHYRNGHYVSGHERRGSYVRAHYRRR